MKRRTVKWGVRLCLIAAAIVAILHYSAKQPVKEAEIAEVKTVAVAKVTREDLARSINLTAELKPYQDIDVHAKIAGYVKEIRVDIGDQVKAGQIIATLDFAEQQADWAKAEASYQEAKLNYGRIQGVIKKRPGLLAQDEVDKARAAYEVAKANRDHAKAFTDYSTISAPFDGIITKRFADKGALIQAGTSSSTQPIVHLSDNTKLRLVFPVPESIVPQIKIGTPVEVGVQVTHDTMESKVVRVSGMIDNATRTMEVEVDLDNHDLHLTPGMYATVKVDLNKQTGVLVVPVQAVAGKEKPTVWVVNSSNVVEERPVTLGIQAPNKVEIRTGVAEGETVIFGSRTVAIGTKVNPKSVEGGTS